MTLVGRTALSVEISTKCSTPNSADSSATFLVPSTLLVTASAMLLFHQRHVLVRGGVEDRVGPVLLEDLPQPLPVAHVGDDRNRGDVGKPLGQLGQDVEDRVLAVPQQDDLGRLQPGELAAELAADRAAGAGDQHRLAGGQHAHLLEVGLDRLAPEQVLDLDLAE